MIKRLPIGILSVYQSLISPFLGSNCRFYPSCSQYAKECYQNYSLSQATWLTLLRLSKCHPWHTGGVDPVPSHMREKRKEIE